MTCAAVSGLTATSTRNDTVAYSHGSSGMRESVMPLQRMQKTVAMMLMAVPMLPMPLARIDTAQ